MDIDKPASFLSTQHKQ